MSKLLLCTLSDGIIGGERPKFNYENEYIFEDINSKKNTQNKYGYYLDFLEYIHNFDRIICIGTKTSDWKYFYEYIIKQKYPEININLEFEDKNEILIFKEEILKYTNNTVEIILVEADEKYTTKIRPVMEISKEINKYDEIFIDITGGLRTVSFMIVQILSHAISLGDVDFNKVNLLCTYFSKNKGVIINQNGILEELDKINKLSSLIRYGTLKDLSFLEDNTLRGDLEEFLNYQQLMIFNKINNFEKFSKVILKNNSSNKFLKLYLDELKENWNIEFSKGNLEKEIQNYFKLLKNYILYKNKGYAIIMLNKIIEIYKIDSNKNRIKNKTYYGVNIDKFLKSRSEDIINRIKNYISHNFSNTNEIDMKLVMDFIEGKQFVQNKKEVLLIGMGIERYQKCTSKITARFTLNHFLKDKFYDEVYIITTEEAYRKNKEELEEEIMNLHPDFDLNRLTYKIIKNDINNPQLEIEESYKVIFELCQIFKKAEYKITLDITHLQRYNIYLIYLYLHIMQMIYKNFKIENVYYYYKNNDKNKKMNETALMTYLDEYNNYKDFVEVGRYQTKEKSELKLKIKELSDIFMLNNFNKLKKITYEFKENVLLNPIEEKMKKYLNKFKEEIPTDDLKMRIWYIKKQKEFSNYLYVVYDLIDLYRHNIMQFKKEEENYEESKYAFLVLKKHFNLSYPKELKEFEKLFISEKSKIFNLINEIKKVATHHDTKIKLSNEKTVKYKDIIDDIINFFEENEEFVREIRKFMNEHRKKSKNIREKNERFI